MTPLSPHQPYSAGQTKAGVTYLWTLLYRHESYGAVLNLSSLLLVAASRRRLFPALHCCPWCRDVKYCVQNCLRRGWGGMHCHDASFYKRLKMGSRVVDNAGNGLYSDVSCVWQKLLRTRCMKMHFSVPPTWRTLAGFSWNIAQLPGKHSRGLVIFLQSFVSSFRYICMASHTSHPDDTNQSYSWEWKHSKSHCSSLVECHFSPLLGIPKVYQSQQEPLCKSGE